MRTALLLVAILAACVPDETQRMCAALDEKGCGEQLSTCAWTTTSQACAGAQGCAAHCTIESGRCVESSGCQPVFPDDGKASHGNADIIGCRHRDGDRCVLEQAPAGAKLCVYRAGQDPCGGCSLRSTGTCKARRPSTFG